MIHALSCAELERQLNLALDRDAAARKQVVALGDCTLGIEVTAPPGVCGIHLQRGTIRVRATGPAAADLSLRGSLPELLMLIAGIEENLNVEIAGDADLLVLLRELAKTFGRSCEQTLAARIGYGPALLATQLWQVAQGTGSDTLRRLLALLDELRSPGMPPQRPEPPP